MEFDPILDADCPLCCDTGTLPILSIGGLSFVETTGEVPCPFCTDVPDGAA